MDGEYISLSQQDLPDPQLGSSAREPEVIRQFGRVLLNFFPPPLLNLYADDTKGWCVLSEHGLPMTGRMGWDAVEIVLRGGSPLWASGCGWIFPQRPEPFPRIRTRSHRCHSSSLQGREKTSVVIPIRVTEDERQIDFDDKQPAKPQYRGPGDCLKSIRGNPRDARKYPITSLGIPVTLRKILTLERGNAVTDFASGDQECPAVLETVAGHLNSGRRTTIILTGLISTRAAARIDPTGCQALSSSARRIPTTALSCTHHLRRGERDYPSFGIQVAHLRRLRDPAIVDCDDRCFCFNAVAFRRLLK
jgi:hypothetical protein